MVSLCNSPSCPGTSSCRPGWPWTYRDLPASASRVLGLKACTTTARLLLCFLCMLEEDIKSPYRRLWATVWVLRIELRTFGSTASAVNYRALSPVLDYLLTVTISASHVYWHSTWILKAMYTVTHHLGKRVFRHTSAMYRDPILKNNQPGGGSPRL